MKAFFELSQGNIGALTFLMSLLEPENMVSGLAILSRLEKHPTIKGTNLYILYSDLCGKDLKKVEQLLENCPVDILADACSRQDYSGRELVEKYL